MSTLNIQLLCIKSKKFPYQCLLPDLAPCLKLSGLNHPYFEQISMVPKMLKLLNLDCRQFKFGENVRWHSSQDKNGTKQI